MKEEDLRQARILMVDDEISGLCLMENVLNRLGFAQVRKQTDPRAVLEEFQLWQPDLVITDLEMPNLGGVALVEQLRGRLPADACLPILVLTGCRDGKAKAAALAAGASDILFKPFDPSDLLLRIRTLLTTRFQHYEIQRQNQVLEATVLERTAALRQALADLEASQRQVVQQERLHAFSEMAGGVVHDFNNSLMSIIGYSELIMQDSGLLDDRELLAQYVKIINVAGRDASHVVSRLRDFYRPRGEADVFSAVNLNELLEAVAPLTKPKWHDQALEHGRTIRLAFELEKLPFVFGNESELREVFTNLVFNAVDALPQGGAITLRSAERAGAAVIEISDTGTGMPEEVRLRCLEPFFSTKGDRGTGLGLAMVFGIVRRHDGQLEIESAPGRGTTIRMTFPSYEATETKAGETRLTLSCSLRVLVVDDEPAARDVVTQYLRGDGHRVTAASGSAEALQRAMSESFDLIITDHGLPEMNGLELAEALHRLDAERPIILLTGFAYAPEPRPPSLVRVLRKPLVPAVLRQTLHEILAS